MSQPPYPSVSIMGLLWLLYVAINVSTTSCYINTIVLCLYTGIVISCLDVTHPLSLILLECAKYGVTTQVEDKGATLLPKVAINIEIENILDIDLEHGFVHLEYALYFDWVDIISVSEYKKSKDNQNYWRDVYPFQPQAQLQNAINTGGDGVDILASKQGTRFGKRFTLGTFAGCEEHVLVTLKRTIKAESKIKLPRLSLKVKTARSFSGCSCRQP